MTQRTITNRTLGELAEAYQCVEINHIAIGQRTCGSDSIDILPDVNDDAVRESGSQPPGRVISPFEEDQRRRSNAARPNRLLLIDARTAADEVNVPFGDVLVRRSKHLHAVPTAGKGTRMEQHLQACA